MPVQSLPCSRAPYEVCSKSAIAEAVLARPPVSAMLSRQRRVLARVARLVARRDEAARAAAAVHVDAERLDAADDDVGAVGGRRREHAERDRVDADDGLGADRVGERAISAACASIVPR